MQASYSGECLCGAVKFMISSGPVAVLSCFCNHCSKGAGGFQQLIGKFATEDVQISTTGNESISRYKLYDTSSGEFKEKAFCRTCGCTLWTVPAAAQGKFYLIRLPLLNGGLTLRPRTEIFVRNRPTWIEPIKNAEQWEEARK
ncbi:hypothetical protein FLAG1_09531 [Fusarium langsethiae]|uniref:CENP-V/GFA domain-containing protein n=1 Tax=Fusarium langsethiae TaxID=179993 RepID=A0A0N1J2D0_FUSLA|nr:hypothetical protein FLAG1_09531 [Fusarium langsethiae]GKU12133.1 unnamed protein product [Fusarium langsethiae]GKU14576.1 unnamed protein product [Fusarium langsethiae]